MKSIQNIKLDNIQFLTTEKSLELNASIIAHNINANGGIIIPPVVFMASDFSGELPNLYDLMSGEPVSADDINENTLIVADGKKRIAAVMLLNKLSQKYDVFEKFSNLDVLLYGKEDLHGKTLTEFIANIHHNLDTIVDDDFAKLRNDENRVVIELLRDAGMTFQRISGYLTFDNLALNEKMLGDYSLSKYDFRQGIGIVTRLLNVGFSMRVVKKKGMIDYFIGEKKINRLEASLGMLATLSKTEVSDIESLPANDIKFFLGSKTTEFVNNHQSNAHNTWQNQDLGRTMVASVIALEDAIWKERLRSKNKRSRSKTGFGTASSVTCIQYEWSIYKQKYGIIPQNASPLPSPQAVTQSEEDSVDGLTLSEILDKITEAQEESISADRPNYRINGQAFTEELSLIMGDVRHETESPDAHDAQASTQESLNAIVHSASTQIKPGPIRKVSKKRKSKIKKHNKKHFRHNQCNIHCSNLKIKRLQNRIRKACSVTHTQPDSSAA